MEKVSVIIPCYNVSQYLDRCMTSVTEQTIGISALEIILVDDASTDETWEMIEEYRDRFPNQVVAIHCDTNGRLGRARNIGLLQASGEWVGYIDADDWIEPTYFEAMLGKGVQYDCDLVCCRYKRDSSMGLSYFNADGDDSGELLFLDCDTKIRETSVLMKIPYYGWGKLFKKEFLLANVLFFPERIVYEDNLWGALLPFYVKRVYFSDQVLYHYFVNDQSLVIKKNQDYHIDLLTVHIRLWNECRERDLLSKYKEEIEYNFLYNCYLGFLKILANRYDHPDYSQFLLLREIVSEKIPDWRDNRYIRNGDIKEFHLALLELLDRDIDKTAFEEVLEAIRRSGM